MEGSGLQKSTVFGVMFFLAATWSFGEFHFPRSTFPGNPTFIQFVLSDRNGRLPRLAAEQPAADILTPMDVMRVCKKDSAFDFKRQSIPSVQFFLFRTERYGNAMWEWIVRRNQHNWRIFVNPFAVYGYNDSMQRKGQTSWISDSELNLQRVSCSNPVDLPTAQINPLPLSVLLQFDAAFRSLSRAQSSFGRYLCGHSRILCGTGLFVDSKNAAERYDNSENRESEIGPIERIVAGIIGVCFAGLSMWIAYGGTPNTFFDNSATLTFLNRDGRFVFQFLLFVICFALSIPFVDSGFTGTDVWVRLLL